MTTDPVKRDQAQRNPVQRHPSSDDAAPARIQGGLVQVAGIRNKEEADMLVAAGVGHLGFPLRLDVHAEEITDDDAAAIISTLRPPAYGVLITYLDGAGEILDLCRHLGARWVQLHGPVPLAQVRRLRALDPGLGIIKSLVVRPGNQGELAGAVSAYAPHVDAFITDTFDPDTGASGATGKVHDWEVSRRLAGSSPRPLILAGGLRPENVRRAVLEVRPAGVDVHTGVEGSGGRKDPGMVKAFVTEARKGFEEIGFCERPGGRR